ncbi:DUF5074 domain-containing protein [uncultured Bacteroides sp.]|uniref:YncE family protein n=1 Tax=uncultured Bacteroides sp. TaxID=162156 RepID=UPI00258F2A49|nr:DUF5074 domain-containing protein [uncultured Bacteroides sp.]
MKRRFLRYLWVAVCLFLCLACREDLPVLRSESEAVSRPGSPHEIKGMFVLNEGNMGSNKCTLDFLDFRSGFYTRNIYPERNPEVVKELGDVGNDLQVYGNRLYAVINCSHYVEVMDVRTARHIGSVNVTNCRYIVFAGDKAYVSSYAGPVQIDPNARPGKIVEFDVNTLQITREVVVGYQPEEMVIKDGLLYVANSGGYRFPNYDRTVSVVDLGTFEVVNTIDVAINLHRMRLAPDGLIYVSSRGDYYGTKSDVFVIDPEAQRVIGRLGVAASEMCMDGDELYLISVEWSYVSGKNEIRYTLYDIRKREILPRNFITDGTEKDISIPYGLGVNPETKEIFVSDATNYVTPGYLYCFSPEGKLKWKVRTGDIPAHFAFTSADFY